MASTDYTGFPIFIPGGGAFVHKLPTYSNRASYVSAMAALGTPVAPDLPFDPNPFARMHLSTAPIPTYYCIGYDPYPDANPYCGPLISYWGGTTLAVAAFFSNDAWLYSSCADVAAGGPPYSSTLNPPTTTLVPTLPLLAPNRDSPLHTSLNNVVDIQDGQAYDATGLVGVPCRRSAFNYTPIFDTLEILGSSPSYTGIPPGSVPTYGMTVVTGDIQFGSTVRSGDTHGGASFGLTDFSADMSLYFIDLDGVVPTIYEVCSLATLTDSVTSAFNVPASHSIITTVPSASFWVPQSSFPSGSLPVRWMLAVGAKTFTYNLPSFDTTLSVVAGPNRILISTRTPVGTWTRPQVIMGFDDGSFTYPSCIPS